MSIENLTPILNGLPASLSEQVRAYTESVRGSLSEIFTEAKLPYNQDLARQLLFFAGIRKLYNIISSAYWSLTNSSGLLRQNDINEIYIGSMDVGPNSIYVHQLGALLNDLEQTLYRFHLKEYLEGSYPEILKRMTLAHGSI